MVCEISKRKNKKEYNLVQTKKNNFKSIIVFPFTKCRI